MIGRVLLPTIGWCLLLFSGVCVAQRESAIQSIMIPAPRECRVDEGGLLSPSDDSFGVYILGQAELTAADLDGYAKGVNPAAPEVGKHYIEIGQTLGVRGDIAFAQAVLETGFFRYIPPGQNNFAGLGAIGGGELGHFFSTPADGVRAQLEHLWAYSTEKPLLSEPIDPRFHFVRRGCAPTWEALGGKWAVPGYSTYRFETFAHAFSAGDTYGQRILKIYAEMKQFARKNK